MFLIEYKVSTYLGTELNVECVTLLYLNRKFKLGYIIIISFLLISYLNVVTIQNYLIFNTFKITIIKEI
jgi:hypothetical protein